MKVYGAASRPIVVRSFVGRILSQTFRLIMPGESDEVSGPNLPKLGLNPYDLPGQLVVRDIGFVQTDCGDCSPLLLIRSGQPALYSRPFGYCPYFNLNEGVLVSFHDESELIGL